MESEDGSVQATADNVPELVSLNQRMDGYIRLVDQLEQKLKEVKQFCGLKLKEVKQINFGDEYREKLGENSKKRQPIAAHDMEIANAKRMQELMHEFGTIIHEIMQQKCAEPFVHPVDVIGLGLYDYYEVVEKPMDFSTIKRKMDAKDDSGYKNVREICADVRLIFDNAMKYFKEMDDVYAMAKTLLDMLETRWLEFLPKVDEEEQRKKEDEQMREEIYLAEEAAHAKTIRDLVFEIDKLDVQLKEVGDVLYQKYCRKMTIDEKKKLGEAIRQLSHEGINKVNEFIAANDPNFQGTEIDLDAQSNSTLWRLKFLVENELQEQTSSSSIEDMNIDDEGNNLNNSDTGEQEINL